MIILFYLSQLAFAQFPQEPSSILTLGPIPYSHSITLPTTIIQPGFKMELSFLVQGSLDGQPGWDRYLFECE